MSAAGPGARRAGRCVRPRGALPCVLAALIVLAPCLSMPAAAAPEPQSSQAQTKDKSAGSKGTTDAKSKSAPAGSAPQGQSAPGKAQGPATPAKNGPAQGAKSPPAKPQLDKTARVVPAAPPPAPAAPSEAERRLATEIVHIEEHLRWLARGVAEQEADLTLMRQDEDKLAGEYRQIEGENRRARAYAGRLAETLWPLALSRQEAAQGGLSSFEQFDREFWWLASVSRQALEASGVYAAQSAELAANLAKREALRRDMELRRENVGKSREEMHTAKARLLAELARLRGVSFDPGLELARVSQPAFFPDPGDLPGLEGLSGRLPWPAKGTLAPVPGRWPGMALSLAPGTAVRAVGAGRVAFDGPIRGMGRVVVLSHGKGYYSVYGFLGPGGLAEGTLLAAGEAVGPAGTFPGAGGPGLYFELRFREKAINPGMWLAAKP